MSSRHLIASDCCYFSPYDTQKTVLAHGDGADCGNTAFFPGFFRGCIAGGPEPEPGGGAGCADAGGEGVAGSAGDIGVPHRLLPQAGGAERKRQEQEEFFHRWERRIISGRVPAAA